MMFIGTVFPDISRGLDLFFATFFGLTAGGLLLASFIQILLWKGWRAKHEFIDRSGKEACNFGLSVTLYLTAMVLISLASFGLGDLAEFLVSVGVIGIYLVPAALFLHFLLAIAGGTVAWRGGYYVYPWTIRFFQ